MEGESLFPGLDLSHTRGIRVSRCAPVREELFPVEEEGEIGMIVTPSPGLRCIHSLVCLCIHPSVRPSILILA